MTTLLKFIKNSLRPLAHGIRDQLRAYRDKRKTITEPESLPEITRDFNLSLKYQILVIGEMSLPQCKKYRVDQKIELFKKAGYQAKALNWQDFEQCFNEIQLSSCVVFYRVPGVASIIKLIEECKRLKIKTFWEADDFIFDKDVISNSRTSQSLNEKTFKALINGAGLYKTAMLLTDEVIASTENLANEMQKSGATKAHIIENALDIETIAIANSLLEKKHQPSDEFIRIVYGSGTNAHNIDFEEAAEAIRRILLENTNVRFRVIGELTLPLNYAQIKDQIECYPKCTYKEYLELLSECDISIAPLENYIFNNSKSNIKYIEASILRIPSVCSPLPNFSNVITNGIDGFLCENENEWVEALRSLIASTSLRHSVGESAEKKVLSLYSPENIIERQVLPLISSFRKFSLHRKKVLIVNRYYNPLSFGGATVVAEALSKKFIGNADVEIYVLSGLSDAYGENYSLHRYEIDQQSCFGIVIPKNLNKEDRIINKNIDNLFIKLIERIEPDLVHFHSIHDLGISMLEICHQLHVPFVVTAHDFWWLYDYQFILSYKKPSSAEFGKDHSDLSLKKREALLLANKILVPSKFTYSIYEKEGFTHLVLNKNGVNSPLIKRERGKANKPLKFGYVGGNTTVKGFHLIREVFSKIDPSEAHLVIVDNALNLGITTFKEKDLTGIKSYEVIPAFKQENIDDFYNSIDVLLYPTQSKESFGLTTREALIRNVWVITSDAGGAAEDVIHQKNGLVIAFNNRSEDLYHAVVESVKLLSEESLIQDRDKLNEHIRTFDTQYEELLGIYKEVINDI